MATYSAGCSAVGGFGYAGRFTLYVVLSNRDGNSATNQSIVDYNVYLENTSGGGTFTSNTRLYFAINGSVMRDEILSVTGPRNGRVEIASGSITVSHNNDGTKAIGFQALVQSASYGVSSNVQNTFELTTIPRASSISCSTANIGSDATIIINSANAAFSHRVWVDFGELIEVIISTNQSGGAFTWTIPESFYNQIPNAKTGVGVIYCRTYLNGQEIGLKANSFTVTTDENMCRPTVEGTIEDINPITTALTGDASKLIKYASTAQIAVTPTAKKSASIKTVSIDGTIVTDNKRTISNVLKADFPIVVTDSRGYTNVEYSAKTAIIDYIPLTLKSTFFRTQPTTGEVSLTYSGNYFNGSFGKVANELSIKWQYKEVFANEWIDGGTIIPILDGNTISENTISLGTIFDYRNAYEFQIVAIDKITTWTSSSTVPRGIPIFNWGKDFFNVNGDLRVNNVSILPVVLFSDDKGTTKDIELLESVANFSKIDICYKDYDDQCGTQTVYDADGVKVCLVNPIDVEGNATNGTGIFLKMNIINIEETTISRSFSSEIRLDDGSRTYNQNTEYTIFKITKVIGYK